MFKEGLKIYPLKDAANPPKMNFGNMSTKAFNTIHANNFEFYEELNHVIQREPVDMIEPQLRGLFASIGIQIGGIGGLAPSRRSDLARFGLRAMVAGNLAAFMSATLAGMIL